MAAESTAAVESRTDVSLEQGLWSRIQLRVKRHPFHARAGEYWAGIASHSEHHVAEQRRIGEGQANHRPIKKRQHLAIIPDPFANPARRPKAQWIRHKHHD